MEDLRTLLTRHGLRCTMQREEIYRALASTKTHPTAEELFTEVRKRQPGLSLATVYNTLDAFTRRGLARKFTDPGAGVSRFDADTSAHVHLITEEGRIRDVPDDIGGRIVQSLPADLVEEVEKRMGVRIDQVRIELIGSEVDGGRC